MFMTLKDIADELNLSIATVSRVANKKDNVNEKTRQIVLNMLNECHYTPNQIARSLKNQYSNTVGIIIPDITEIFFAKTIKGIDEVLTKEKYSLIVADSNESEKQEKHYIELLFQKRIDALILATVSQNVEPLRKLMQSNIPIVFVDNLPNMTESYDAVVINNAKASMLAVQHLLDFNHSRIAVIIGSQEETTGYERLNGYKRALALNHIPIDDRLVKFGNYKTDSGYNCMRELLKNKKEVDFTAVYITSEKMTFGAMAAICEAGLSIPDDISIVSFDFHDRSGLLSPTISTVVQPEGEIGRLTAQKIIDQINYKKLHEVTQENIPKQVIFLEPQFVEGSSIKKL
jgi:LacI family transcriptional regulator